MSMPSVSSGGRGNGRNGTATKLKDSPGLPRGVFEHVLELRLDYRADGRRRVLDLLGSPPFVAVNYRVTEGAVALHGFRSGESLFVREVAAAGLVVDLNLEPALALGTFTAHEAVGISRERGGGDTGEVRHASHSRGLAAGGRRNLARGRRCPAGPAGPRPYQGTGSGGACQVKSVPQMPQVMGPARSTDPETRIRRPHRHRAARPLLLLARPPRPPPSACRQATSAASRRRSSAR
jgi:hypothetical protein